MATISAATSEKIFQLKQFYGLNENPDGDTKLKLGEAAAMRNFRVTRDGNLQRRPGTLTIKGLAKEYTLDIGTAAEDVLTATAAAKLKMQPTARVVDGLVELSGEAVSVDYSNATEHTGLYWRRDASHVWKLADCIAAEDGYVWRFYRVRAKASSASLRVAGIWTGFVSGREELLAAADGKLWRLWDAANGAFIREAVGDIDTSKNVHIFGFSNIVYMLNGSQYKQWDGTTFQDVHGYRPLVRVSVPPAGGGETKEEVNRLCGERRLWISPDGEAATFALPEKGLTSVDYVKDLKTNENIAASAYSSDLTEGTVTFTEAPAKAVNSYEIGYTMPNPFRSQVTSMRYSELYNSTQDTRVFIYGDGTYKALYSGIDYDGQPRADYFPDLYEMAIGDANTPITALIRHYSTLICFKSHSTYSIRYGDYTLSDGRVTAAFYSSPINRTIGNAALGQAQLVLNSPRTAFGGELYEWKNSSAYSSNLTADERQAKRISDRIYATLGGFDLTDCVCYDDNANQEYYICYGGKALVHNYAADAWYVYDSFYAACLVSFHGDLLLGTSDGRLLRMAYEYLSDDGEEIDAYWESGSMSFGQDYMRKYAAALWIGIKPETNSEVYVTVQTDRKSVYTEKVVDSSLSTFDPANFAKWSFLVNRKPRMTKLKIKAKKFVFYKLIFKSLSASTTATILAADIRVRYTGQAK